MKTEEKTQSGTRLDGNILGHPKFLRQEIDFVCLKHWDDFPYEKNTWYSRAMSDSFHKHILYLIVFLNIRIEYWNADLSIRTETMCPKYVVLYCRTRMDPRMDLLHRGMNDLHIIQGIFSKYGSAYNTKSKFFSN